MEETVYYDKGGNKVTSARFIVGGTTHALSGITSVATRTTDFSKERGSYKLKGIALMVLGGICILGGFTEIASLIVGIILAFFGFRLFKKQPSDIHHLVTSSASGETEALSSIMYEQIKEIENAITDAIIARG